MAQSLVSVGCLYGWRPVRIPQHGFETACEVVGKNAGVVLIGGHEGGHAQQEQHQGLDGQRRSQNAAEEPVAPGEDSGVDGVAAQAIVSTGQTKKYRALENQLSRFGVFVISTNFLQRNILKKQQILNCTEMYSFNEKV